MLRIDGLSFRIGGDLLFEAASARVGGGQRVGLVGRNGSGKSTLLRLIVAAAEPGAEDPGIEAGAIAVRRASRIGFVSQDMPGGAQSVVDMVLGADIERARLLAEADTSQDAERLAVVHERLIQIEAATAPARVAAILAGLGFEADAQARPVETLSGGWRRRVALARALFLGADFLILDEPSNHLDLESRLWLEGFLARYAGTLLLVSHDRALLNRVCREILHLEGRALRAYRGNYDAYIRVYRERRELEAKSYAKQQVQRRHMQAFVDRFRYKASKARQAQSRLKALEKLSNEPPATIDDDVLIEFPEPAHLAPPLIALNGAEVGYDGKPVLHGLDFSLGPDDRIALLGRNGNGKTTLLRLLEGALAPISGEVRRSRKLRVGYFSQEQTESFELAATPLAHMQSLMPRATPERVRAHLGRFGFVQAKAEVAIGKLSGGERARLLLAVISRGAPQLLLLDEPSNHLDIHAREALVGALATYRGAVVLVSHDPFLVELIADRLWLVADGRCANFDGDLADYARYLADTRSETGVSRRDRTSDAAKASKRDRRRAGAAARAATATLRRAVASAEADLARLLAKKGDIEATLADRDTYDGPAERVAALRKEMARLEAALSGAEKSWEKAQEALDAAS